MMNSNSSTLAQAFEQKIKILKCRRYLGRHTTLHLIFYQKVMDQSVTLRKGDFWSCSIIAYIMLCGKPPFNGSSDKEILSAIKKGFYNFNSPEWTGISDTCRELISMLLTLNPDNRPTAGEAMDHKWIREALSDSKQ